MSDRSKSFIYSIWNYQKKLPGTQLSLRGHSRGSESSCFYIPELKLFLDAGLQAYYQPEFIFVTHCHSDHSFQLPMILTGLTKAPNIYVPAESRLLFQNFLSVTYQLRKGTKKAYASYQVNGVVPGDVIELNKDGYFVRVYRLYHNVPTRGYGICQRRKKLKEEYHGLDGKKLKNLKDRCINIVKHVEHKLVVYVLDTNIKCFTENRELLEYKYVMVECTFFMDEKKEDIEGHIHWNDLKPIVKSNPGVNFILIHFSMRYSGEEISNFFEEEKKDMPNIDVWLN